MYSDILLGLIVCSWLFLGFEVDSFNLFYYIPFSRRSSAIEPMKAAWPADTIHSLSIREQIFFFFSFGRALNEYAFLEFCSILFGIQTLASAVSNRRRKRRGKESRLVPIALMKQTR